MQVLSTLSKHGTYVITGACILLFFERIHMLAVILQTIYVFLVRKDCHLFLDAFTCDLLLYGLPVNLDESNATWNRDIDVYERN